MKNSPPRLLARALRRLHALVFVFASGLVPAAAQNERVVFDFTGTNPAANLPWTATSSVEPGLTTAGWTMGPGLSLVAPRSNRLAFSVNAGSDLSTLEEARAAGAYLNVTFASPSGPLQLGSNRIRFTIRRESFHAPLRFAVYASTDNFTAPLFVSDELEQLDDGTHDFSFLLPLSGFDGLSVPVDFRIYPFAARFSGHALSLTAFSLGAPVQTYTLTAGASQGGAVQVSPAGTVFEAGQSVRITAVAAPGQVFSGWTGDASGKANPLIVTMIGNRSVTANFQPRPPPRMELGGNLDALVDYTTAWVFKDCFKLSRQWLTRSAAGEEWESFQNPPLDADGWPQGVPFAAGGTQHYLHTLLPLYGPGAYTLRFQGAGRIDLIPAQPDGAPDGSRRQSVTGTGGTTSFIYNYDNSLGRPILYLEVRESAASAPVRSIEVIAPGQDNNLQNEPFHPDFVASLSPYRTLRFMDWMQTNFSPLERWADRTTPSSSTQARFPYVRRNGQPGFEPAMSGLGVAHEYIIALANQTGKDPWICLPHRADDDYVRQTARLYRDALDPSLKLYVEYSNETWNPGFEQTTYVQDRGEELGLDDNLQGDANSRRWQGGQRFVARRSAEVFGIFAEEYGAAQRGRYVAVLATQAANSGLSAERLAAFNDPSVNTGGERPDALAIAPYFGVNYVPELDPAFADPTSAPYTPGMVLPTGGQIATALSTSSISEAVRWTVEQRAVAEASGLRLVCYEGGQHFNGVGAAQNDAALIAALHAGNRDPRMEDRYREYLAALEQQGVDLFVNFTHIGEWSRYGSWSVLEGQQQSAAGAPKWRALLGWLPGGTPSPDPTPSPTPAASPTPADTPAPSSIGSVRLLPAKRTIRAGKNAKLVVVVSNDSMQPVTTTVTFNSSNGAVVAAPTPLTLTIPGKKSARQKSFSVRRPVPFAASAAPGVTQITASAGSVTSAPSVLTVR